MEAVKRSLQAAETVAEREIQRLEAKVEELKEDARLRYMDLDDAEKATAKLRKENQELRAQVEKLGAEGRDLINENRGLRQRVEELERRR